MGVESTALWTASSGAMQNQNKVNMCDLGLQLSNSLYADSFSFSSKAVFFWTEPTESSVTRREMIVFANYKSAGKPIHP